MRLYQFRYSPYAAKVRLCLQLKRLPFDIVEVPYLDRRELMSVTGGSIQIPVLTDGDKVLLESAHITGYLDERYAPSLRPGTWEGPAVALEQWADSVLEDVAFRWAAPGIQDQIADWNGGRPDARAFFTVIKERKFGAGCVDSWRRSEHELASRCAELLAPMARTLEMRPFLLGDVPTVGDAAVWSQLYMVSVALPGRIEKVVPRMMDWYRRLEACRMPS
jgi:glutathione S-transferase